MMLKESNPYLRNLLDSARRAALRVSAQTSSAVEGIRAPLAKGKNAEFPASKESFVAYWQQRAAATAR